MTDDPGSAGPESARGGAPGGAGRAVGRATPPGGVATPEEDDVVPQGGAAATAGIGADEERVVIRDNRKINVVDGGPATVSQPSGPDELEDAVPDVLTEALAHAAAKVAEATKAAAKLGDAARAAEAARAVEEEKAAEAAKAAAAEKAAGAAKAAKPGKAAGAAGAAAAAEPEMATEVDGSPADAPVSGGTAAERERLRAEVDERTKDLQRVTAEYANYRKRVDRDRALVVEQATGNVLSVLLPILDDLDRARDHGDLVGPVGAVADQLTSTLAKFGLTPFGTKGDPFDPTLHEAVSHGVSAEVTEPTCVGVMRRGYLLGERLLRPALVAVADPE